MGQPSELKSITWISDEEWALIAPHLPGQQGQRGGVAKDNRLFVEAVFWLIRNHKEWKKLPPEYGDKKNVNRRFTRWRDDGIWQKVIENLLENERYEWLWLNDTLYEEYFKQERLEKYGQGDKPPPKTPRGRKKKLTTAIWPWLYMIYPSETLLEKLPKALVGRQIKIEREAWAKRTKHSAEVCRSCGVNAVSWKCKSCRDYGAPPDD